MMPISEQTAKFIDVLETEGDIESKLRRLLEREFLRRLTGYRLTNRLLSQKYEMDYDTFIKNEMVKKLGYSFEVEQDLMEWEIAQSGIRNVENNLSQLVVKFLNSYRIRSAKIQFSPRPKVETLATAPTLDIVLVEYGIVIPLPILLPMISQLKGENRQPLKSSI